MIEIKNVKNPQKTAKNGKKRQKKHDLDKYLKFCFAVLFTYTIAHSVIFYLTGQEASTLSVLVFGVFGTSEPIICGLIKIYKLRNEKEEKKDPEEGREG